MVIDLPWDRIIKESPTKQIQQLRSGKGFFPFQMGRRFQVFKWLPLEVTSPYHPYPT